MNNKITARDFLGVLFEPNEVVSFCTQVYEANFLPVEEITTSTFFCINPINPNELARKDSAVSTYRNILIEIDTLPLADQADLIKNLCMPYSTAVFSGGKSIHFIISLETPLSSREIYDHVVNWVHNIVGHADKAVKSPSKLSRFPNTIRVETGREQKLLQVKQRINNDKFLEWLLNHEDKAPKKEIPTINRSSNAVKNERTAIINAIDWYIETYLKRSFDGIQGHFQCPLCAESGYDNSGDNMFVSGQDRRFHCFKDDDHNKVLLKKILSLKYSYEKNMKNQKREVV